LSNIHTTYSRIHDLKIVKVVRRHWPHVMCLQELRDARNTLSHHTIELSRSECERRRLVSEIDHLEGLVKSYRSGHVNP
jgi:acyl-CoA hydrolase